MNIGAFILIIFAFFLVFSFISNNLNNSLLVLKADQLKLKNSKLFAQERHQSLTNIALNKLEVMN